MIIQYFCFRFSCAIELDFRVILTGGNDNWVQVTEYNQNGYIKDLPKLLQGRMLHGCGHYISSNNEQVVLTIL